jgi:2-keto-4-pentenoate hydratase/2-oxohepta-3-ene-1,7-dioic acid hydratase in catechol pathway
MQLATFTTSDHPSPVAGEIRDGRAIAFEPTTTVLERLISEDRTPAAGRSWPLAEVTLLEPIPAPRAIFCIGLNYALHVKESGAETPKKPVVFFKLPSSSWPPNAPVSGPAVTTKLDYEGELTAVIGSGGRVAGYAVADDLSARDLQATEPQWTRAKAFDGSCPWGPWITTADAVPDPGNLRLRTWVNGDLRQDSSTSDLLFDIPQLVAFLSETFALQPGDLILTGTPVGVGMGQDPPQFLTSGDVVKIEIEGLGTIEHPVA